ncbi:MAG: hypothetical protein KJ767_02940 [Nanoarchaeota archaeon]|nr:hypothetical protein [Nanoarchaeota archaeon]
MKELNFRVLRENGLYSASVRYKSKSGSGVVTVIGAKTYEELKQKVKDATLDFLSDGFGEKIGLVNPKIRLQLQEKLMDYGNKERILIAGNPEGAGYRAISNSRLNLDIYNDDFELLRENLVEELQKRRYQDKNVEFRLEEVLD